LQFLKTAAMKQFVEKEARIFYKVLAVVFVVWVLCCLWNGVWGYRRDVACEGIEKIYTDEETAELALAYGQAEEPATDSLPVFALTGDSVLVNDLMTGHIAYQNLTMDSGDVMKIKELSAVSAFSDGLMLKPPVLFKVMFYCILVALLIFYPVRIAAGLFGCRAVTKH
jgi:hypothetical protein